MGAPAIASQLMGAVVMKARKAMKVPYPNLYATPGHHDKADAFNRVQRGHQSLFESISDFRSMALIGGLKHPLVCSASGLLFSVGYYFFQKGYADTNLKVATARYKKGGQIKWLGYFGVSAVALVQLDPSVDGGDVNICLPITARLDRIIYVVNKDLKSSLQLIPLCTTNE